MTTTKVTLEFINGSEKLVAIYKYIEDMEAINKTFSEDMRDPQPMDLEFAILCLITEGLRAFNERDREVEKG